jgi:hypothetical protein
MLNCVFCLLAILWTASLVSSENVIDQHIERKLSQNVTVSTHQVAICVTGQLGRLQPNFILDSVITANNDGFDFKLFFVFQNHMIGSKTVFNTGNGVSDTVFASMSLPTLQTTLESLFLSNYSSVATVSLIPAFGDTDWKNKMENNDLNRIYQYTSAQTSILNMYDKQVHCATEIERFELETNKKFDLVVSTREDIFFFAPLNMTSLYQNYILRDGCDVIMKDCLDHGGVNMRFQMFNRKNGLDMLRQRLMFYKSLYKKTKSIFNPESFEHDQFDSSHLKICKVSVDLLPATAARHTYNGSFCFISWELASPTDQRCIPKVANESFLSAHRCHVR